MARVACNRMELGDPDASGRRRPVPVEGGGFTIEVDAVVIAVGTTPSPLIRNTTKGIEVNPRGCFVVSENTGLTSRNRIYAGGDAVTGAATVILAMGAGKTAAKSMDESMQTL